MKYFLIMVFCFSLWPAKKSQQSGFKTIEVKGLYSLDLPEYLEETNELNSSASLQFRSLEKKLFVIALDEEKSKIDYLPEKASISGCYDFMTQQVVQKLEEAVIDPPSEEALGSLKALQGGINGKFRGTQLRYILEVIESESHFYQIICWTEEGALKDVGNDIHLIINSFKELL